jgi:hypothetical protein
MKRDLNLFTAYKHSNLKDGKSSAGVFLIISLFIFAITGSYGGLLLYESTIKSDTARIKNQLDSLSLDHKGLEEQAQKNQLLNLYYNVLIESSKNFDSSVFIDTDKLGKIAASVPASVTVDKIEVTPQTIQLSCYCINPLDPAQFTQALRTKNLFSQITYDGVVYDKARNVYSFNINCYFNTAQRGKAD